MPIKPLSNKVNKTGSQYSNGSVGSFYSCSAWIKLRNYKRLLNPICESCESLGLIIPYHTIDHIKPISEGGEALSLDNLQTLCKQCHAIKTVKETSKRKHMKTNY
jgi:5-methylcytosine-specific restriction protein A